MFSAIETFANATVRQLIESVRGQYFAVVFVKRDGTIRRMTCQRGNDAKYMRHTERGEQASATFHRNNPHMLRVRDAVLARQLGDGSKAWRTIDLAVLCSIQIGKRTIRLRSYREALANVNKRIMSQAA
jgi:hypothetical protein